ncbi:unnamed protein product [Amoebophrya sp. A25]|nr:unnamed protein product [Amoebophrya sp. A25]|eukprot:GSA25T00015647001.1
MIRFCHVVLASLVPFAFSEQVGHQSTGLSLKKTLLRDKLFGRGTNGSRLPSQAAIQPTEQQPSECEKDETWCESLKFCLPPEADCSKCVDYSRRSKELGRCTPAPVEFAVDFCGNDAMSVSCQNYATGLHNCMSSCGSLHPTGASGEFIACVTASDGSCPAAICEAACGCIGKATCEQPCMQHCTDIRDRLLHTPHKFKTRGEVYAFLNNCVFGKKASLLQAGTQGCGF